MSFQPYRKRDERRRVAEDQLARTAHAQEAPIGRRPAHLGPRKAENQLAMAALQEIGEDCDSPGDVRPASSSSRTDSLRRCAFLWVFVESISAGDGANFAPDQISRS